MKTKQFLKSPLNRNQARCLSGLGLAALFLGLAQSSPAVQVTLAGFVGYGYNTINNAFSPPRGFDGQDHAIGCGPTSGAMVLGWYTTAGPAPGLIGDPLVDARIMYGTSYMQVGPDAAPGRGEGFGPANVFGGALEQFALDRGYMVDAVIHVEPTTYDPANWATYGGPVGVAVAADADFWNTSTWDINDADFLNFIAAEIDVGKPFGATVDSNGDGNTDHWMVGVGYDRENSQWLGYNTWDNSLHTYDIESAFIAGNPMGIGFIRTFDFLGPVDDGIGVPEGGSAAVLLGCALLALAGLKWRLQ